MGLESRLREGDFGVPRNPTRSAIAPGRKTKAAHAHGQDLTRFHFPVERFRDGCVRLAIIDADGKEAWTNPIGFV